MGTVLVIIEARGRIEIPSDKCQECEGHGYHWGCMDCYGDGCLPSGNDCPTCNGTGQLDDPQYSYAKTTCEYCDGTGKREDCEAEYQRQRALWLLKNNRSVIDPNWIVTRGVI